MYHVSFNQGGYMKAEEVVDLHTQLLDNHTKLIMENAALRQALKAIIRSTDDSGVIRVSPVDKAIIGLAQKYI